MNENPSPTDYLVSDPSYKFGKRDADIMFATSHKREPIEAAKDFGQGTVVALCG